MVNPEAVISVIPQYLIQTIKPVVMISETLQANFCYGHPDQTGKVIRTNSYSPFDRYNCYNNKYQGVGILMDVGIRGIGIGGFGMGGLVDFSGLGIFWLSVIL